MNDESRVSIEAHQATIDAIKDLIQEQFDIDPATVDPLAPFADYDLDSLTLAELVFALEDHFGVDFPEDYTKVSNLLELSIMLDSLPRKAVPAPQAVSAA
jgi:acyl carrier protein